LELAGGILFKKFLFDNFDFVPSLCCNTTEFSNDDRGRAAESFSRPRLRFLQPIPRNWNDKEQPGFTAGSHPIVLAAFRIFIFYNLHCNLRIYSIHLEMSGRSLSEKSTPTQMLSASIRTTRSTSSLRGDSVGRFFQKTMTQLA
jgi:hypothetical protein